MSPPHAVIALEKVRASNDMSNFDGVCVREFQEVGQKTFAVLPHAWKGLGIVCQVVGSSVAVPFAKLHHVNQIHSADRFSLFREWCPPPVES